MYLEDVRYAGFSSTMETAPAADLEEAVQALEERALERQARLEAALLQVLSPSSPCAAVPNLEGVWTEHIDCDVGLMRLY